MKQATTMLLTVTAAVLLSGCIADFMMTTAMAGITTATMAAITITTDAGMTAMTTAAMAVVITVIAMMTD